MIYRDGDRPVISVLMPVRNAQDTVEAAIDSIRAQSFGGWELRVVDDGSTDASSGMLEDFAREDPRIRVRHIPHGGIVSALRTAAAEAEGVYFARMDADDICRPERFGLQLECFARDPDLGICGGRVQMTGEAVGCGRRRYEDWINGLVDHDDIIREIFVECPLPHPTFMISREWFQHVGGYQECPWPEDYDLVMRLWRAGARFAKPELVILDWRNHPARLSMTDSRYNDAAFRALKRHYLRDFPARKGRLLCQWGAGEVGKRWLREWKTDVPVAVVDINPRKIDRIIHGVPVIAPEKVPPPEECFVVVMVGTPGARDEIRGTLRGLGFHECEDYLFLA